MKCGLHGGEWRVLGVFWELEAGGGRAWVHPHARREIPHRGHRFDQAAAQTRHLNAPAPHNPASRTSAGSLPIRRSRWKPPVRRAGQVKRPERVDRDPNSWTDPSIEATLQNEHGARDLAKQRIPAVRLDSSWLTGSASPQPNVLARLAIACTHEPTAYDPFAEALLRAGEGAYLHGESVLALFGLADVNPRTIKVAVHRLARAKLPPFVKLTQAKDDVRTMSYEGLAAQPVPDAILECRGWIERERLLEAAKQARGLGAVEHGGVAASKERASAVTHLDAPRSVRSLEQRTRNLESSHQLALRCRVRMALVVVGQMLPEGAIKGGSAMALRCGRSTRFAQDPDAAPVQPLARL